MIAQTHRFTVVLEPDEEGGGFVANVPALPGCHTEGDTREEAIAMAKDAVATYVESLLAHGEPIPQEAAPLGAIVVTVAVKTDVQVSASSPAAA